MFNSQEKKHHEFIRNSAAGRKRRDGLQEKKKKVKFSMTAYGQRKNKKKEPQYATKRQSPEWVARIGRSLVKKGGKRRHGKETESVPCAKRGRSTVRYPEAKKEKNSLWDSTSGLKRGKR